MTTPTLLGIPLAIALDLPDGRTKVMHTDSGPVLFVGAEPRSAAAEEAVRIVNRGLADVLDWLGWPTLTGRQLAARLTALAEQLALIGKAVRSPLTSADMELADDI